MFFTRTITKRYTSHVGKSRVLYNQGIVRTIVETISGIQTIRSMALEKVVKKRFSNNLECLICLKKELQRKVHLYLF